MDYSGNIVFESNLFDIDEAINGFYFCNKNNGDDVEIVCIDSNGEQVANYSELGYAGINECLGEVNILCADKDRYLVDKKGNVIGNKIEYIDKENVSIYGEFIVLSKNDDSNTRVYSKSGKLLLEVEDKYNVRFLNMDDEDKVLVLYNRENEFIIINVEGNITN